MSVRCTAILANAWNNYHNAASSEQFRRPTGVASEPHFSDRPAGRCLSLTRSDIETHL